MNRDELEAQIAQDEAAIAAKKAELAALDVDPWDAAVGRYMDAADVPHADRLAVKRGLIAALPLAPADPVDEEWIEATAREVINTVMASRYLTGSMSSVSKQAAILAIRATLNRGARRSVDLEKRDLIDAIIQAYNTTRIAHSPVTDQILSKPYVQEAFERFFGGDA